ncbi:MAG: calcium/sodium antiporter [Flavobacteriales bacterium]|nr:calcium/sodium antiporter [Flavobacteriales bacterium]
MALSWVQLIGGLVILIIGGDFLVRSSVKLALYLRISSLVIGLTVVSFGTSFPELVVSMNAALDGHPDISVGNVVGSNIANLALVLGISAMFFPMAVRRSTVVFDWPMLLLSTVLLIVFAWDLHIELWEGLVFFTGLIVYNFVLIRGSRKQNRRESAEVIDKEIDASSSADLIRALVIFGLSLIALVGGADLLVNGAVGVALSFGIEERIIAVSIVAFGTSAPELATSMIALYKKESSISVGNLIGSNIFNILGILGLTAIVSPVDVNPAILEFDMYWALAIPLLLYPILLTRLRVARIEGVLLFATYVTYLILIF